MRIVKPPVLSRLPLPAQFGIFLICTLSLLWGLITFDLHRMQEQILANNALRIQNLVRAFAEEVKSSVNSIDLTLIDLRDRWQSGMPDFAETVRRRQAYLEQDVGFQVAIIDAKGKLVFSSTDPQAEKVDLSDREHFLVHRDHPEDQLFISKPVLGRVSHRWSIQFTRPLSDDAGRFAGVIVLSVSPDFFSRFYQTIDLGEGSLITLVHASGEILARSPHPELGIGRSLNAVPFRRDTASGSGLYEMRSELDGIERLFGWRRLPKGNLVVLMGLSLDTIFESYHRQQRAYALAGAGISLLLGVIGYFLLSGLRQRSLAIDALADSEARWKFALEGAGEGVWDWNIARNEVQYSRRWKEILGFAENEIGNQVAEWSRRLHPDDQARTWDSTRAHLEGLTPDYQSEHRLRCSNGEWKWVLERGMVVSRDNQGKALRMVGTCSDISPRKEAERLSQERTRALEETRKALHQSQKLEALGRLTGGIAHDFNNVLQTLTTGIQLALFSVREARLKSSLEACQRAVERGMELTRQLLVFGRVQEANVKTVNLEQKIKGIVPLLRGALPSHIQFNLRVAEDLWPARIDPLQFELALLNLAVNARDAMPDGGQFRIDAHNQRRKPASDDPDAIEPGDYIELLISDTGEGMSKEVLAKALDPFFTTKVVGKGSGMGLAQAYGFARQMGGTLSLASEPGQGVQVSILLPRAPEEAPAQAVKPATSGLTPRGQGNILFVEDDPLVRETVCPALEAAGFEVTVADNGADALRMLESGQPIDLLFSDIVMPGEIGGIELAGLVQERFPAIRIILATGYSERRISSPHIRTLAKPYDIATLVDAINDALLATQDKRDDDAR